MAARELRCRRGHGNADGGARHVSHVAAYTDEDAHSRASQVRRDCLRGSSSWNVEAVQRSHSSRRELGTGRDMAQVCEVGEAYNTATDGPEHAH